MISIQDNIARLKSLRSLMSGEPWAVKTVQQLTEQIQDLEQELTNPSKKVLDLPL
jgi:predicted RNase H-like nuclease (RuvC/YqgF family)